MEKPLTHQKRIKVFAKVIRKNTGHDFITCLKLSKLFLTKNVYLMEPIMYPFDTEWSVIDSNYTEREMFNGKIIKKADCYESWEIPSEFYLWQR